MKLFRIKTKTDGDWLYVAAPNMIELVKGYMGAIVIELVADKCIIYREQNV
jgi:hypothetical protein